MKKYNFVKKIVEEPAELLEKTVEECKKFDKKINHKSKFVGFKKIIHGLGPGITTGASDDDPSGIITYSQTGAKFGFNFLWLSIVTLPLMAIVQEMCARIGLATGEGLAANIRKNFSRRVIVVLSVLLFFANTFNIGADLGAMASATKLIFPNINFIVLVFAFVILTLFLQIFMPYEKYAKYLKWLSLVLFAYIASALFAHLNWSAVLSGTFMPKLSFSKDELVLLCAIIGTTISPYLFFWQTSQEVEDEIASGETTIKERRTVVSSSSIKGMKIDVWLGMIFSNVVMFFIIAACGGTLNVNGITNINTAAEAAEALRPFAGDFSCYLFVIGIIGTGLLAIPVLAGSSSYAISESFKWREGLSKKLKSAYAFYGIIIISMIIGFAIEFSGINSMQALIYSALINGIVAPAVILPIILISSSKKIMGQWTNHKITNIFGWIVFGLMVVSGISAIMSLF